MLVVMKTQATPEQIQAVCEHIEQLGFRAHPMPGAQRTAIGITGNQGQVNPGNLEELSGVQEVIEVSKPYKLVSRDSKEEDPIVRFRGTNATIESQLETQALRMTTPDILGVALKDPKVAAIVQRIDAARMHDTWCADGGLLGDAGPCLPLYDGGP